MPVPTHAARDGRGSTLVANAAGQHSDRDLRPPPRGGDLLRRAAAHVPRRPRGAAAAAAGGADRRQRRAGRGAEPAGRHGSQGRECALAALAAGCARSHVPRAREGRRPAEGCGRPCRPARLREGRSDHGAAAAEAWRGRLSRRGADARHARGRDQDRRDLRDRRVRPAGRPRRRAAHRALHAASLERCATDPKICRKSPART